MKGLSTAVLTLFLAAAQLASLAAVRPDGFRPPANLQVDVAFQQVVERMWQGSPTFRRQCRRLAAEQDLQVKVSREDQLTASFADARTAAVPARRSGDGECLPQTLRERRRSPRP
jgi:hypothetical protein